MTKKDRTLFTIISILLVLCTGYLMMTLIQLKILPPRFLFLLTAFLCTLDTLLILLQHKVLQKTWKRWVCAVSAILVAISSGFIGFSIQSTQVMLEQISGISHSASMVSVIVKESSSYQKIQDLQGRSIGVLRTISRNKTDRCLEAIRELKVDFDEQNYDSLVNLLQAFYAGQVESVILPESSRSNVTDMEAYANFNQNTRVIFQKEVDLKDTMQSDAVDDVTKNPFNVLITGSDSRTGIQDTGRSDVNMIVTINPTTHKILLTSIPRDYYVKTVCDVDDECQNGAMDKLTHTGLNGTNTTKMTLENLFGIKINYSFKVGFESVQEVVDALGGIDVDIPQEAAVGKNVQNDGFHIEAGLQHLDGKTALRFSRERYAYASGDRQRTRNQQIVLMGIINQIKSPSILVNYTSLLNALGDSFQTNLSRDEIAALVQFQLDQNPSWTIEQFMVDGTGEQLMCAELGNAAYVMVPNQETVKTAIQKINTVLDGN